MRYQDQDAVNREARDVIQCNPDHIRRDRSMRQSVSQRRLSFILTFDECANFAPIIDSRSAWIDERIRNLSELA